MSANLNIVMVKTESVFGSPPYRNVILRSKIECPVDIWWRYPRERQSGMGKREFYKEIETAHLGSPPYRNIILWSKIECPVDIWWRYPRERKTITCKRESVRI